MVGSAQIARRIVQRMAGLIILFFFQAEDGIRDVAVTGVQTCALPIYLCTNALLLKERLTAGVFEPSKYLSFSIHMDGLRAEHDEAVCREGVYDEAGGTIREALRRGLRVTTNTNLFDGANPLRTREVFDAVMDPRGQ